MNRVEISKAYRIRNKPRLLAQQKTWRENNRVKRYAHNEVLKAVRAGVLLKPAACINCQRIERLSGHHEDYSEPLDVQWLCSKCHAAKHSIPTPMNHPKGERHGCAKLSSSQVMEIRRLSAQGRTQSSLAEQFETSQTNISAIVRLKAWKHLSIARIEKGGAS